MVRMMDVYEKLANAIVLQAVKDYRNAKHSSTRTSVEQFFCSRWFQVLTSLDGEKLIIGLRRELDTE